MKISYPNILAPVLLAVSAGCVSHNREILSSFVDITSAKYKEGGSLAQYQAASVNGLLPFEDVGETYFFAGKRGMLTAIGISAVTNYHPYSYEVESFNTNGPYTLTYKRIREYASPATLVDLQQIRSNILNFSTAYVDMLARKAALLDAQRGSNLTASSKLQPAYLTASSNAQAQLNLVLNQLSRTNLIMFQWDASDNRSALLKVGDIFGASHSHRKGLRGFALVAGLRTTTLHVGTDLVCEITRDMQEYSPMVAHKIVVPTFAISAAHLLYFAQEDLENEVQAKLKASYSQLANGTQLLKSLDNIEATYLAQQLKTLCNTGAIEGPTSASLEPVPMFYEKLAECASSTNWTTFYAVTTCADDITKLYRRTASSPPKISSPKACQDSARPAARSSR